jgi:L-rhamnose mutarotase
MTRHASIIGLDPAKLAEYKTLHAAVWPEVLEMIAACHIRNYSIFLREIEGKPYLFSYFEYHGTDLAADGAMMAADPVTQRWWALGKPCQIPLPDRADDEWWAAAEEVFHCD